MTSEQGNGRILAYLLVVAGLFLLAANLGWLGWVSSWFWAVLFLAGGVAFFVYYRTTPKQWWALIPAFSLAAIGIAVIAGDNGGPLFLGLLAAGFAAVALTSANRWWAVIPSGVLATLALVAWLDENSAGGDFGWLFFLGLALTFGVLYILPTGEHRRRWAAYPALALLAFSLVTVMSGSVASVVLPLALVLVGASMLWRRGRSSGGPHLPSKGV